MADVVWVTVIEVSEITGLEVGRVIDLLKSGELPSRETGKAWLVDLVEAKRLAASIADGSS